MSIIRGGRGKTSLFLLITGIYVVTRKKYRLPDASFFIPNLNLFTGNKQEDKKRVISKVLNAVNINWTSKPKSGWLVSIKPIYGIKIPVKIWLPWDAFIAIPQVKNQIGKNIIIKPKWLLGRVLGYNVNIKNVTFWA